MNEERCETLEEGMLYRQGQRNKEETIKMEGKRK
jgi:hypothetical protein